MIAARGTDTRDAVTGGGVGMGLGNFVLAGTLALLWALSVVAALAAIRTGWLLPWLRRRTFRPRLWGYGTLLAVTGMCMVLYGVGASGPVVDVVFGAGLALVLAGAVIQFLASRPGSAQP